MLAPTARTTTRAARGAPSAVEARGTTTRRVWPRTSPTRAACSGAKRWSHAAAVVPRTSPRGPGITAQRGNSIVTHHVTSYHISTPGPRGHAGAWATPLRWSRPLGPLLDPGTHSEESCVRILGSCPIFAGSGRTDASPRRTAQGMEIVEQRSTRRVWDVAARQILIFCTGHSACNTQPGVSGHNIVNIH